MTYPKAFISHASEDKSRFVLDFAARLRERGIDAWLDRWEIKLGDSIVEKIFEEGIKNADAFIIVLSAVSVTKPWVREELDNGIVRRIEKSCRVIPVVIEECEIPQSLKHLRWVKIKDLSDCKEEIADISGTILGVSDRPPIGPTPAYAKDTVMDYLPGLTRLDNLVFRELCRHYLETGWDYFRMHHIVDKLVADGASNQDVMESLEILDGRGHIKADRAMGVVVFAVTLSRHSLDQFIRSEVVGYDQIVVNVISKMVNEDKLQNTELKQALRVPLPIVNHIMLMLEAKGYVQLTKSMAEPMFVRSASPELKRLLR